MAIKVKRIKFNFPKNISHCVHDVISVWLRELDQEKDEIKANLLKQKVLELEQVISRDKPHIHFLRDPNDVTKGCEKIIFKD